MATTAAAAAATMAAAATADAAVAVAARRAATTDAPARPVLARRQGPPAVAPPTGCPLAVGTRHGPWRRRRRAGRDGDGCRQADGARPAKRRRRWQPRQRYGRTAGGTRWARQCRTCGTPSVKGGRRRRGWGRGHIDTQLRPCRRATPPATVGVPPPPRGRRLRSRTSSAAGSRPPATGSGPPRRGLDEAHPSGAVGRGGSGQRRGVVASVLGEQACAARRGIIAP